MESIIINLLSIKSNISMSIEEIERNLEVDKKTLLKTLDALEEYGTIYKSKKGRYSLVSRTSLKVGLVKLTSRKGPIVKIDGIDYKLIYDKHNIIESNMELLVDPNPNLGTATIVRVLSSNYVEEPFFEEADNYEKRLEKLYDAYNFNTKFSNDYLKELKEIPSEITEEEIIEAKRNGVYDLRDIPSVTIDSEDTKDFDDAVAINNNILFVSIADLNRVIKEGSVIEKEAIARGTSVYPPGKVNPMFHNYISNGICSLNPETDRFTNSLIFKLNDKGNVVSHTFGKSIIRSRAKLTYEKVNEYLEEGQVPEGYEEYTKMLDKLYSIAMKVKKSMLENGFLIFDDQEVKFLFENEKVVTIKKRKQGKAEELIEFLMLLNNMTKCNYMMEHKLPFIARNHELPNNDKLSMWVKLLKQRGYKVEHKEVYTNEDIKNILSTYKNSPERAVLDNIAIRSQAKAKYSAYNKGHFALGLKAYATFTSPIRRLSDYINERIFEDSIVYGDKYAREKWEPKMEYLAKVCTDRELAADKIERKADNYKKLEYMSSIPIGSKYTGTICDVGRGYIGVLLPNMIYGKVYISSKEHSISKDGYSLYNNITGEHILVGDSIDVSLAKVDMNKEEIYLLRSTYRKEDNYEEEKGKKKVKKR